MVLKKIHAPLGLGRTRETSVPRQSDDRTLMSRGNPRKWFTLRQNIWFSRGCPNVLSYWVEENARREPAQRTRGAKRRNRHRGVCRRPWKNFPSNVNLAFECNRRDERKAQHGRQKSVKPGFMSPREDFHLHSLVLIRSFETTKQRLPVETVEPTPTNKEGVHCCCRRRPRNE